MNNEITTVGWEARTEIRLMSPVEKEVAWGDGQWCMEPDIITWQEPTPIGPIECGIRRSTDMGNLSGYVAIPKGHPFFGNECADLDCHGGITFSEHHNGRFVTGFDCAHATDLIPITVKIRRSNLPNTPDPLQRTYRTVLYCRNEIGRMICSLVEAV